MTIKIGKWAFDSGNWKILRRGCRIGAHLYFKWYWWHFVDFKTKIIRKSRDIWELNPQGEIAVWKKVFRLCELEELANLYFQLFLLARICYVFCDMKRATCTIIIPRLNVWSLVGGGNKNKLLLVFTSLYLFILPYGYVVFLGMALNDKNIRIVFVRNKKCIP